MALKFLLKRQNLRLKNNNGEKYSIIERNIFI